MRSQGCNKEEPTGHVCVSLWPAVGRWRSEAAFGAAGCHWKLRPWGTSRLGHPASNFLYPLGLINIYTGNFTSCYSRIAPSGYCPLNNTGCFSSASRRAAGGRRGRAKAGRVAGDTARAIGEPFSPLTSSGAPPGRGDPKSALKGLSRHFLTWRPGLP